MCLYMLVHISNFVVMKDKDVFNENARIRKFTEENERLFVAEINDENNPLSYDEIFDKYNKLYIAFAEKHNSDKRNIYTGLRLDSFEVHFKAMEK